MPDYEKKPEADARPKKQKWFPSLHMQRYGGRLPYVWYGMRMGALLRLLQRGRYDFTLNCIPDFASLFLWVPFNTPLQWLSEAIYGRSANRLTLDQPPIFLMGHWRTGTTFLHDLFACDPNLAFPTTFACFFPGHFLLTEKALKGAFSLILPKKRPQDDVPVGFERPQEEEFAMLILGEGTPYTTMAWPRHGPADSDYLDFEGLSEAKLTRWADAFMWFYRRLLLKDGKPLVMKSPANAGRLRLLTKLFPDARFIYLARNPLEVFPSTVKLWRALYSTQGFHNPPGLDPWLDDYVLDMFQRLTEDYERDKHLIPSHRLVELRYEDVVKDPLAAMGGLYRRLALGDFAAAEAPMREYLASRAEHRVSEYELPPALKARIIERLAPYIDRYGYRADAMGNRSGASSVFSGERVG